MIRIHNLWKSYDDVSVLRGLSLFIPAFASTVILGRSGVGKSVLLRQIAGLEVPDEGTIEIEGTPLSSLSDEERQRHKNQTGMLFQGSALFDSMNVEENVAFALLHRNKHLSLHQPEVQHDIEEALVSVDLAGFQKKYPSELSGGQKRRAALARLIVYKPKLLLFDEPTTGLDPITASQIARLIVHTQKSLKATVVVVTHDIVSALTIGEHFALHEGGVIRTSGDKESFFGSKDPFIHHFLASALVPERFMALVGNREGETS